MTTDGVRPGEGPDPLAHAGTGGVRVGDAAAHARLAAADDDAVRAAVAALLDGDLQAAPIVQAGAAVLRQVAVPWTGQVDAETFGALVDLMIRTMHDAPGVGLAAPQIGLPLAIAVLGDSGIGAEDVTSQERERVPVADRVLVNPRWRPVGEERVTFYEGCLSVDGWAAATRRWRTIELVAQDETGQEIRETLTGWPARIVQHEVDHLRGTLYVDHAEMRSLTSAAHAWQWAAEPAPRTASGELGFPLDD